MPLSLIVGPPNSGRASEIRKRIEATLRSEPFLVVPTGDDATAFERELCRTGGGVAGVEVGTFARLVDAIAAATSAPAPEPLSAPQRLALVRRASREVELRLLARSARRTGFAPALDRLIGELQAALLDPGALSGAEEGSDYEAELDDLYGRYVELRDGAGRGDDHTTYRAVVSALRFQPGAWGGRPVLLYGFDDLTEEQLELVAALAAESEVTVAVNYADREALKARAELRHRLVEDYGASVEESLPFDDSYTERDTLRRLDRELFEPSAERVDPDGGLALTEAAGERGEAEGVAAEIAALLAGGEVRPDEILVVLRNPDRHGPLYDRALRAAGIPAAVEAKVPLAATATGRAIVSIARAALPGGTPEDLLAHLRARPDFPAGISDNLELRIRRERPAGPEQAVEGWANPPRALVALADAPSGAARLRALATIAREIPEAAHRHAEPLSGDRSSEGVPLEAVELRAGAVAASVLDELAALDNVPGCAAPELDEALAQLDGESVPLWRGPTAGRVRVLNPYRARAARARHLFLASLQEGEFPGRRLDDPLLGEERRAALGIAALRRRDPLDEERYLFHACASRPTDCLWLSWRSCDEEGAPAARSPFVDDVLDLIAPDPETAERELVLVRGLADVVPAPAEASSERILSRSLGILAGEHGLDAAIAALDRATLPDGLAADLAPRLRSAAERGAARPGPLGSPAVIGAIAAREAIGAGTLERWLECPYRWFVQHELGPQGLDPDPEYLRAGSIVHKVLEILYRDPPGDDTIPRPADVGRWRERAGALLAEQAEEFGFDVDDPRARIALSRSQTQIEAFLGREAEVETRLRPALLEASFGEWEEADRPVLELGKLRLHGMIDRVDTVTDGDRTLAVVYDYKTGKRVTAAAKLVKEGKLQPQLYAIAARENWGFDPVGALYHPLGASDDPRPRGLALKEAECTGDLPLVPNDRLDREGLDEALDEAERIAGRAAGEMRDGEIGRRPLEGSCPTYCTYQPICRKERGLGPADS